MKGNRHIDERIIESLKAHGSSVKIKTLPRVWVASGGQVRVDMLQLGIVGVA